jgi:hypothetical protein
MRGSFLHDAEDAWNSRRASNGMSNGDLVSGWHSGSQAQEIRRAGEIRGAQQAGGAREAER